MPAELRSLLTWARDHGRDLPWRRTRDPWAVLVSEVMLQQTQADRVGPRWSRFLARWPTATACAAASLPDVVREWHGLGYPRRARRLWETANIVVDRHGAQIPDDLDALLALPGIGPYTARAVLAFAFERDVGVVDTNGARVLARLQGQRLTPRAAQEAADAAVPPGEGWAWNQAVLDLGAMVCRPVPRCERCPVAARCRWRLAGRPEPDPAVGSAGVSTRQAPFAGSDRQARGRLMAALTQAPVAVSQVARAAGLDGDPQRAARIAASLVADGLVERSAGGYTLAGG